MTNTDKVEIRAFNKTHGFFQFYHEQGILPFDTPPWNQVLAGLAKHYDIYRQGKSEHANAVTREAFGFLEGNQLNFMNYFLMTGTAFTSWFAFHNTMRYLIDRDLSRFRPYSMGEILFEKSVDELSFNLFEYLRDRDLINFLISSVDAKWSYGRTQNPKYTSNKFKYTLNYFVDPSGKWVYFTFCPETMRLSFFMTFLQELAFLLSYYDRKKIRWTDGVGSKKDSEVHKASCLDERFCYHCFRQKGEIGTTYEDHKPSVDLVSNFLTEMYLLQEHGEGDWSLLRPENYDFFEMAGGLNNLNEVFFQIFFLGFLRTLVQGQLRKIPELENRCSPMGEFQRTAFSKSQPHFKFLGDVNLTHTAEEYYKNSHPLLHHLGNMEDASDMLLHNPDGISQELKFDLIHGLSTVRDKVSGPDKMLPIFGFALTEEGKEEEKSFSRMLFQPDLGRGHAAKLGSKVTNVDPYGAAVSRYILLQRLNGGVSDGVL